MTIQRRVSYMRYRIVKDRDRAVVLRDNWTDLPDEAIQVQKFPNYDWPLVSGLIRSLETRVNAVKSVSGPSA
jgi:hypothetical protein